MKGICFFLVSIIGSLLNCQAEETYIWIEGESPDSKSIQQHGWYNSVQKSHLSGKGWLGHFGKDPGKASYSFTTEKAEDYTIWWRVNPVKNSPRYRIDKGEWKTIDTSTAFENINIATDGKPDLRFISWIGSGAKKLKAGKHQIEIEFQSSGNHQHGAIDCLCLTTDKKFKPSKTLQPGEKKPFWPAPEITENNLDRWLKFIEPTDQELGWRSLRWHSHLSAAAQEARQLNRPILLWAMNGHPCGET